MIKKNPEQILKFKFLFILPLLLYMLDMFEKVEQKFNFRCSNYMAT